ncbi:MAG: AsmA-like C-terminal region-containing protein, partial [Flavobacterium sp.]
GTLIAHFSKADRKIKVDSKKLKIGEDGFDISAVFNLEEEKSPFFFDINTRIKWRNASDLLSNNISSKLNKFNLLEPIKVNCTLNGDFNAEGDPEIIVRTEVRNNELSIPDGLLKKCSFNGKFTNNFENGKGYEDANSAIILTDFSGTYENVPFSMSLARINNLDNPIATGKLKSEFELTRLKDLVNEQWVSFQKGKASVNLDFKVDIVDLRLRKPYYTGVVSVKDASFRYEPKNIAVENTDVLLSFTPSKFSLQKLRLQNDKNIINMDFTIDNYLNLYYNDPSKIVINWNIYSPYLDVKELLGFFVSPKKKPVPKKKNADDFSNKAYTVLDKCQMILNLKADKIKYNQLTGLGTHAVIMLKDNVLSAKNGKVATSDGTVTFEGMLTTGNHANRFASKVDVRNVNISKFLAGFDNFGIKSFKPQSIKGSLSLKTDLKGTISSKGELVENSLNGNVEFNVNDGALVHFEPMKNIGKFIPNRNFDTVTLYELGGKMYADGGKVNLDYFKLTTSVINLDMSGVYSFDKDTNLAIAIPLRNPKDDYKIKNRAERDKLRYKGAVLRLRAVDVNGKTKLKLDTN